VTNFFLIRHASCRGLGQMLWGHTPGICLNDKGKLQAQRLADRLRGMTLQAIYSSPLERALETAEVLARSMKLEVKKSPALNEIDYGDWTGKTLETLSGDERWRHFNSHRRTTIIPGGESFLEVQNRIVKEMAVLLEHHRNAGVAIVSHADVIRAAVGYFSATPIDFIQRIEISPCSVSVVAVDEESTRLLTINNRCDLSLLWAD
jgi:broad specificity phosphatase PhoE